MYKRWQLQEQTDFISFRRTVGSQCKLHFYWQTNDFRNSSFFGQLDLSRALNENGVSLKNQNSKAVLQIRIRIHQSEVRSGFFDHQAKIVGKTLISTVLGLLYDFLCLKNFVHVRYGTFKNNTVVFFDATLMVTDENSRIQIHQSEVRISRSG